jgi:DNA-directed RNA polymerase subunit RPC12/RpoP
MRYECNECKKIIDEGDLDENSLGDPECPHCGSNDVTEREGDSEYGN